MLTENGMTADLDCVTDCRPCYPGHWNSSIVPSGIVVHSIESDIRARITAGPKHSNSGLMGVDWMNQSSTESSVHFATDPECITQGLSLSKGCWGAGSSANAVFWQIEQAGRAAMSRAQWTTSDGLKEIHNTAKVVAGLIQKSRSMGRPIPVKWATDAEIRNAYNNHVPCGLLTHADVTRVLGHTTHTDPGSNYPKDLLLQYVNEILSPPAPPKPTPAPKPIPVINGDDDMYSLVQISNSAHPEKVIAVRPGEIFWIQNGDILAAGQKVGVFPDRSKVQNVSMAVFENICRATGLDPAATRKKIGL